MLKVRSCQLYRLYDQAGVLLYVGISMSAMVRQSHHKGQKAWWPEVARIEIISFDRREDALEAERNAIFQERPIHNKHHAPKPDPVKVEKITPPIPIAHLKNKWEGIGAIEHLVDMKMELDRMRREHA